MNRIDGFLSTSITPPASVDAGYTERMPEDPRLGRARAAIHRARSYTLYSRCARWAPWVLVAFCVSVPLFLTGMWIAATRSEFYGSIIAAPAAAIVLLSGLAYPWLLTFREAFATGQRPWRFSLRTLLIVTTLVAMASAAFYAMQIVPPR